MTTEVTTTTAARSSAFEGEQGLLLFVLAFVVLGVVGMFLMSV